MQESDQAVFASRRMPGHLQARLQNETSSEIATLDAKSRRHLPTLLFQNAQATLTNNRIANRCLDLTNRYVSVQMQSQTDNVEKEFSRQCDVGKKKAVHCVRGVQDDQGVHGVKDLENVSGVRYGQPVESAPSIGVSDWCINRLLQLPLHTWTVALLQVVLFYALDDYRTSFSMLIPLRWELLWKMLTHILAHQNTSHLFGNTFGMLAYGSLFEFLSGSLAAFVVFWGGALVGSSMEVALWSGNCVFLLGSSGGVMALMGALLGLLLLNFEEIYIWKSSNGYSRRLQCLQWTLNGLVVLPIVWTIGSEAVEMARGVDGIAHAAHLFGGVCGFLLALAVGRNWAWKAWERRVALLAGIAVAATVLVAILWVIVKIQWWSQNGPACSAVRE